VIKKSSLILFIIYFIIQVAFLSLSYSNLDKSSDNKSELPDISKISDDEFLNLVQKKAFLFFWKETNPETGLVKDKTGTIISSVAAVGFGLTCICIAENRGWISKDETYGRILNTLRFFKDKMKHKHGFYYHFVHMDTGEEIPGVEVSSIDTALFLAGALFAGKYFEGTEIEKIANELYERVNWKWMLNGGTTLSLGWKAGNFLVHRWNKIDESLLIYILAIGSPTYPIPASSWDEIVRPIRTYKNYTCIVFSSPLFVFQYPHLWIDFRNKHDKYADYFKNSVNATLANRQFCIDLKDYFKTYGSSSWGITACDGPTGYKAYRALPSVTKPEHDGTVAPTASGASMMFTPEKSLQALKFMYSKYKNKLWCEYGFKDSYNLKLNWFSDEVIGIDQGALMIGIENYRSGLVWKYFMKNNFIKSALGKIGFKPGTKKVIQPPRPEVKAYKTGTKIKIDGNLNDWSKKDIIKLLPNVHLEYGSFTKTDIDLLGECWFAWDEEYLYFGANIVDNEIISSYENNMIYRNDCIELFIDPDDDGLLWGSPLDYQIGLSPATNENDSKTQSWSWFQKGGTDDLVLVDSELTDKGYVIEAAIRWEFLNIKPQKDLVLGISPALHDLDNDDNSPTGKLNWYYLYKYREPTELGKLILK